MYEDLNLALGIDTETVPWHGFVLIKDAGPRLSKPRTLIGPFSPSRHTPAPSAAIFLETLAHNAPPPLPHPAALTLRARQHRQTRGRC